MKDKIIFKGSNYKELIVGKDDTELSTIAEKHFIVLPSRDLALFKCIFAKVDKENLNGCTIAKKDAEKALPTLTGKAVDFDHYRKSTVGHWLEASLEGENIIAYGVFYKGNHSEAYEELQDILSKSELGVSFEAWGDRTGSDRHYSLSNIEFAGGALLPTTKPAFPGAKVLEMANEKRAMTEELHKSSFSIYDCDLIMRLMYEIPAPKGEEEYGFFDIQNIDFVNAVVTAKWVPGDNVYQVSLKPSAKKQKTENGFIEDIKLISKSSGSGDSEDKNRKENNVEVASMEKELQDLKAKVAALEASMAIKEQEIAKLQSEKTEVVTKLEEAKNEVKSVKSELENSKAEAEKAVELAAKNAKIVAERRAELGDIVKDMSDSDLLDENKYVIAKKDKEIAALKAATPTTASTTGMTVGSKATKDTNTKTLAQKVREHAFKQDNK